MDTLTNAAYVIWMLVAGLLMGSVFDFYSTVTGTTKYLAWMRPVLDVLFWVSSGVLVYYLTFITIDGTFRVYTFLLICVGYVVYRMTFRRIVIGSAHAIMRMIRSTARFIGLVLYRVIGIPLIALGRLIGAIARIVYRLGERIEDILAAILRTTGKVILFPWKRFFPKDPQWRKKLQHWEQGFWTRLSNVLRKKEKSS